MKNREFKFRIMKIVGNIFLTHICLFKDTGIVSYVSPLEYEEKCDCGKIRWRTQKSLTDKTIIHKYSD